jgi:signal transduction histidine kinase
MKVITLSVLSVIAFVLSFSAGYGQEVSDSLAAKQLLDQAKQNFGHREVADSLALAAYNKSSAFPEIQGESAYILCFINSPVDFPRARQWGDSAISCFRKTGNPLWIGYTHRVLGIRAQALNRNDLSLEYLQTSQEDFEAARDTVMQAQTEVSISLLFHNNMKDFSRGREYAEAAIARIQPLKNPPPHLVWQANNALAINFDDAGNWDEALRWHRKNLATDNSFFRATTLNNLGNTMRKKRAFVEAESYFLAALPLVKSDDAYTLATLYLNLSQVNEDLGRRKRALGYNDSSLHYANQSGNTEKLQDSYEFAHRLYYSNGESRQAYDALQHYMEIKDSVLSKEKAEVLYELEERFQSLRKEQEIARLRSDSLAKDLAIQESRLAIGIVLALVAVSAVAGLWLFRRHQYRVNLQRSREREEQQLQRFRAVIEAEENERSRVAKDLHDGLGQLISTAKLGLTALAPAKAEESKVLSNSIQVLDQATQEVRTIAHNLMPAVLSDLGLQMAVADMVHKINDARLLNVELQMDLGDDRLPSTVEVAVYRVIQEVLNNMIKHSRADRITVTLVRAGKSVQLAMADNGVGLEESAVSQSRGLGWKNIASRIALLNGTLAVDSRPGAGTQISIQFALT